MCDETALLHTRYATCLPSCVVNVWARLLIYRLPISIARAMYQERRKYYSELESIRESKVLMYFTSDRRGMPAKIATDAVDLFVKHLDAIGDVEKITLYLYSQGGGISAAWTLINLIRGFCKHLEVVVPRKAHSAATLICIGADNLIMTKQATLGPIDPSIETALNPAIDGAQGRYPVSVEAVSGFLDFARNALGKEADLTSTLLALADRVHPLVLGDAYRIRGQIRMLARKLLPNQLGEDGDIETVLRFLASESGSHDYTINRREAKEELGLTIEKPNDELYALIKIIYDDVARELDLYSTFDPNIILGQAQQGTYKAKRAFIESVDGGSHYFGTEGTVQRHNIRLQSGVVRPVIQDTRTFDGWRHDEPATT